MVTVGLTELAYWMPRTSCLPPAPLSPDCGSNTPILMTLEPLDAQPANRHMTITAARSRAMIFFIEFFLLLSMYGRQVCMNL